VQATTDQAGTPTFSYGTATRNSDGSISYAVNGSADAGSFDLTRRSVRVKVDVARLNALQKHGLIKSGTSLIGLRGQATADRLTVAGLASVGFSDSTRGGGAFTIGSCQQ
jgi:hypothetical protein